MVWDKPKPQSAQQEKFCKELAESVEIEPDKAVLSAYKSAYSTAGKSDDKLLSEGLKIASTLKDYIEFLKSRDPRIMISPWDYQMLKKINNEIIAHKLAANIIWPTNSRIRMNMEEFVPETGDPGISPIRYYHEFHINWEYLVPYGSNAEQDEDPQGVYEVRCKSLLDGLTLDFKNKKAIIYDLKTTAKLWHFEESIEMYDYYRQLCYYTMAVDWYLEEELGENPDNWTHEWYIIGIDTTGSNEIRVFKIDKFNVYSRKDTILNAMQDIMWHQERNLWEHSRAYYEGDGSETLML